MIDIDGSYLEGGGQILRTAAALSLITGKPIRITNIRKNRASPGLKPQHLSILLALGELFFVKISGLSVGAGEITFIPAKGLKKNFLNIDVGTAGSIGLILQSLLFAGIFFADEALSLDIKGGSAGLGAMPVDYYPNLVFPLLYRSGIRVKLTILRRGYYPRGGAEITLKIEPMKYPASISLNIQGKLKRISCVSIASSAFFEKRVAQRQAKVAKEILVRKFGEIPIDIKAEYTHTYSTGSEINLYAYTDRDMILGAEALGEKNKTAETVGQEAADKLIKEIDSGGACDTHLADNLIPYLALLGGSIRVGEISMHAQTNIWVSELFFGKIFTVENGVISVENGQWKGRNC